MAAKKINYKVKSMNGLLMCTNDCNLRCKYCFEECIHREKMKSIQEIREEFSSFLENDFDKFIFELVEINKSLKRRKTNICFHGGEPLLVGTDLLEKGFSMVKKYDATEISIQTNATLINDEMIELFKKYDVHIGISIDGPKEMNDKYRVNANGKGSYDVIVRNLKKMKEEKLLVGALATVTKETIKDPEGFYNFFRDNKINFSFNPLFLIENQEADCDGLSMNEFADFYCKMFDIWIESEDDLSLNCFDRILSSMGIKEEPYMEVCTYIPDCSMTTVAINTKGDFFRCLHYALNNSNCIGNIHTDSLFKALGDERFKNRSCKLKTGVCANCDIYEYCYGGCPFVAESTHGTIYAKDNTCAAQRKIVHYIKEYLMRYKKQ